MEEKNKTINIGNPNSNSDIDSDNKDSTIKKVDLNFNKSDEILQKNIPYNDEEMNSFNYEDAKIHDNKTYCQYYISLLRTKHILIFTFFQNGDYNSKMIKIYIFFLTFAINYLVSAMFYSDSTMHKIYIDKGAFDFTYQLPQMIYSLIISTALKTVLGILGFYEENITSLRNMKKGTLEPENVLCKIKVKIAFFFIITFGLLFLFWVYLGCFCAVYKNTQIHLLLDVSSSFGLSFISPFFIHLLPGFFRIPSLKEGANKPCLFRFSKLLQIL